MPEVTNGQFDQNSETTENTANAVEETSAQATETVQEAVETAGESETNADLGAKNTDDLAPAGETSPSPDGALIPNQEPNTGSGQAPTASNENELPVEEALTNSPGADHDNQGQSSDESEPEQAPEGDVLIEGSETEAGDRPQDDDGHPSRPAFR